MPGEIWLIIGCLGVLLLGTACFGASATPHGAARGTVSGRVVTLDGRPVAGARVWLDVSREPPAETRSDADGRFRLTAEAAHRLPGDLLIEADGFARQYVNEPAIFPKAEHNVGEIILTPGRRFSGQVLDIDGKPRADAPVRIRSYRMSTGYWAGPARHTTTDADGRFRTPALPVGKVSIEIRPAERQLVDVVCTVLPGDVEETLPPVRLREDFPISGEVKDDQGQPIAGAKVEIYGEQWATSDADGRFVLRGFAPNPRIFQMFVAKEGYIPYNGRPKDFANLLVTLRPVAWITGRAEDADTGQPVRITGAMLCGFEWQPDGSIVRRGCRIAEFEQPQAGRFRIVYARPAEYRLTLTADGYHDSETFLPPIESRRMTRGLSRFSRSENGTVPFQDRDVIPEPPLDERTGGEDIVVKLRKKTPGSKPEVPRQRITGTVNRGGKPVPLGWISLWAPHRREPNVVNAFVQRGRTVPAGGFARAYVPAGRDGAFTLDVPYQGQWYVVAEEPGQAATVVGPLEIVLNVERQLDIACTTGGSIAGRVRNVPEGIQGHLWVVAFDRTVIKAEARVAPNGTFRLDRLPPGEYGLKVGHDAFDDAEVPRETLTHPIPKEARNTEAAPWKRAKVVTVDVGRVTGGVELELPADQTACTVRVFMGGVQVEMPAP